MFQRDPRYKQGIFNPINPQKYVGTQKPIYRSSFEVKFFKWCDRNDNVLSWSSESIVIPYKNPVTNRVQRYFVDNYITLKEGNKIQKYLVEIKPYCQTIPPILEGTRKRKRTLIYEKQRWIQNQAKWEAAKTWADKHNAKFIILTEKDLF